MAKNTKYLQYVKSRNKSQLNIDLQQLALEFDRLLNKKFCYVFSGGIRVEFQFKMENFYHLLGFHKLSDVTVIRMVENHKMKKEDFFKFVRAGKITMDTTDEEILNDTDEEVIHIQDTNHKSDFGDIKANRFQFFSEKNVLELLISDPVIDFDNKECNTVIDADKVFFKLITEKFRNLNLFIGYDEVEKNHYTATFFLEKEKDKYLFKRSGETQTQLKILSRAVTNTRNNEMVDFHVKWENVREEFADEPYYKGQSRLKAWIKSKHILSKQVIKEIEIQKRLLEQYRKAVEELTIKFDIVTAVLQLEIDKNKEEAQLQLMEYNIDAENEAEIAEYKILDLQEIKNDKLRMEAKFLALKNKLQKHEKYLPDIVELEEQEVVMVYQEYLKEVNLDKEQIGKLLNDNDLFEKILFPDKFAELYGDISKNG